ncbi:LOW QUALITY PROTEIN: calsyntenin-1-like [Sinocyclocheilus rhinocerous]|uniref:LOW QUALITY PROTEIN: calsyntenin-1-like n=1 Tax=Sinocyclocheilus rhinocerous TaxID=307959 RepID=UPI0007B8D5B6|nr:PREDICTED: LOW QUALITY PROTEIN: calsyntenin-1-like [Sinocyclocheilus rhinocerous]
MRIRGVNPFASAVGLLLGLLCAVEAAKVNKHKPWIETTYHGIVTENDDKVLLDPPLIALDKDAPLRYAESFEVTFTKEGEICGFRIHGQNVPFEAMVLDKSTGEGVIRAKDKLDCELQKEHTFTIQAYDCGEGPDGSNMKKSHKATVHIQVNDVNEYSPVFKEKSYKATVIEGKKYDSILKVEAVDADCSFQFSQICSYEIVTPDVPFTIDKDGNIKNTEKLNYSKEHLYKLTLTAYDCGKNRASEDVLVKINIKPTCKPSWQGFNKRIEYEPGTGSLALFPSMHLETCEEPITSIQASIMLETNHIGKGCDRDTYSEKSLHKLCGASAGTVELLPAPSNSANWTVGLPTDNGHDSDQVFEFNGTQAIKVPEGVVSTTLKEPFTISVWMRHGPGGREKETILCNSDKTEMNRHHYSLYVHNCRLVLLLRQEPTESENYKPAEFHWKLDQVCDKEWHHYVLNIEFPAVTLFVDGATFEPFLVTEDYPLHASKIETQLTIGGCWQDLSGHANDTETLSEPLTGGSARLTQYFRGNLAGLMIRSGKLENKKVIDCLYTCKEGLDVQLPEEVASAVKVEFNPNQSSLSLEGDDIEAAETEAEGEDDPTVQETVVSEEIMHNLDTCEVTVVGDELNGDHESLEVDLAQIQQRALEMSSSNVGMVITGVNTMVTYEQVLHLIRYRNWHTEALFDRKFKLVCSELNGRYISNEFKVEVNVIHTANPMDHANNAMVQPQFINQIQHASVDLSGHNLANTHQASVVPSAATVVIVVCVSFLVFMIILGVFRIRAAHQHTMRDQENGKENEMDWDDSALTITVNPMETYEDQHSSEEEGDEEEEESEDGEEEDDITSAESDSSEDEGGEQEDQQGSTRQQQLEWDDSTY